MQDKHTRRILISPSCFSPDFIMEFNIPNNRDDEEYIDEILDAILKEEFCLNCEWYFQ